MVTILELAAFDFAVKSTIKFTELSQPVGRDPDLLRFATDLRGKKRRGKKNLFSTNKKSKLDMQRPL